MSYKLLIALAAAAALFVSSPALALSVTYDIDAHLGGLDFDSDSGFINEFQEGIGSATFEMPAGGTGRAVLTDFEMTILGETFVETDDWFFPLAPSGSVVDGALAGVTFQGSNANGAFLYTQGNFAFSLQLGRGGHIVGGTLFFREAGSGGGGGGGGTTPMPEPSAALVFATGLAVVARRQRLL